MIALMPRCPCLFATVIENGQQVALGLTRAGTGSDYRGLPRSTHEALQGDTLVVVGREPERYLGKRLFTRGLAEGQRKRQVRPAGQIRGLRQEVVDDASQLRVGRLEAGYEEVAQRVGDFDGDNGGDHGGVSPSRRSKAAHAVR